MNKSALLLLLLTPMLFFVSCETETEKERQLVNEKVSLIEATTVKDTPMMLGMSIYKHLENKENLSVFRDALTSKLKGLLMGTSGPYTLLVPTNKALSNLSTNDLDESFLKKYIVKGKMTTTFLVKRIREHGGVYTFIALAGNELTATRDGMDIVILDPFGGKASLKLTDYLAENGVVHTIDTVLK